MARSRAAGTRASVGGGLCEGARAHCGWLLHLLCPSPFQRPRVQGWLWYPGDSGRKLFQAWRGWLLRLLGNDPRPLLLSHIREGVSIKTEKPVLATGEEKLRHRDGETRLCVTSSPKCQPGARSRFPLRRRAGTSHAVQVSEGEVDWKQSMTEQKQPAGLFNPGPQGLVPFL